MAWPSFWYQLLHVGLMVGLKDSSWVRVILYWPATERHVSFCCMTWVLHEPSTQSCVRFPGQSAQPPLRLLDASSWSVLIECATAASLQLELVATGTKVPVQVLVKV